MFGIDFWKVMLLLTLTLNLIHRVKTQMMPEYDDYPQSPDYGGMPPPPRDPAYDMDGMDEYGPGGMGMGRGGMGPRGPGGEARKNEVVIGRKRFKLYEKKRLNHNKAKEFCKKKAGKLAEAQTLDEMRRLESLFARARMIGMDVWVGEDKKKWKKHSWKNMDHPGLNLNGSEAAGIRAMMMGGGQKEMCPAIGLSTRSISQVQCIMPLPFICEYDRNRPRTTRKPKGNNPTTKKSTTTSKKPKKKKKSKRKDEMK